MSEQSIASARASVMVYNDELRKWVPSGSSSGLSKVHIYQHMSNIAFRVVGRKLQDHEVVINCSVLKTLRYNQATPTFHQWRDSKQAVYGLNFSSKEDADNFAAAMLRAIEILNSPRAGPGAPLPPTPPVSQAVLMAPPGGGQSPSSSSTGGAPPPPPPPPQAPPQPIYQSIHGINGDWDDGEDPYYQERRGSQNQMLNHSSSNPQVPMMGNGGPPPGPPPVQQIVPGHHRTSSAPPAPAPPPPPPPIPMGIPGPPQGGPPPPPPPVMNSLPPLPPPMAGGPAMGGGAPPPPPPLPMGNLSRSPGDGPPPGSLAAALQGAKLKKRQSVESMQSSSSSASNNSGTYGTLGRVAAPPVVVAAGGGMAEMMDEMTKTLARRRAMADRKEPKEDGDNTSLDGRKPRDKTSPGAGSNGSGGSNSGPGCKPSPGINGESPKSLRRRMSSTSEEGAKMNGSVGENPSLDALKHEIMREVRNEINRMKADLLDEMNRIKQEIVDAMKMELNRR